MRSRVFLMMTSMSSASPSTPRRILVVASHFIGDTVLLVPFLRQLKAAHPTATIDVLSASANSGLLANCPLVEQTIHWPKGLPWWRLAGQLKPTGYDKAYVLKRSLSAALLAWAAGIPARVGFSTQGRSRLLTHPVPYPETGHEAMAFLNVLAHEGHTVPSDEPRLELWPTFDDQDWAKQALAPYGDTAAHVGIHAFSSNPAKDWPLAYWPRLMEGLVALLQELEPSRTLVFHGLGGHADSAAYDTIRALLPPVLQSRLVDWSERGSSLRHSAALIQRFNLVVGVDSGPLHLAAAVGTPTVAIFGPSSPDRWTPISQHSEVVTLALDRGRSLPCQPCQLRVPCHIHTACLRTLPPDQVLAACRQLLLTRLLPLPMSKLT
jgi:heptosyltransferase II